MGVEAARARPARGARRRPPAALYFATAAPAYVDKTNATAIHAALGLAARRAGLRHGGLRPLGRRRRCGPALDAAGPTLAVLSDIRTGLPGGADEGDGGDAAVAVPLRRRTSPRRSPSRSAAASATGEFLDRWRLPGEAVSRQWEERFGEHAYVPLGRGRRHRGAQAGRASTPATSTTLVVAGPHGRAVRARGRRPSAPARGAGRRPRRRRRQHGHRPRRRCCSPTCSTGPSPARSIALVSLADGADVVVCAHHRRPGRRVAPARHGRRAARPAAREPRLRHVPHLARLPPPRAAAPPRPERAGGAAVVPRARPGSSRFVRQPLTRLRHASTCRPQRVCVECQRHRPDDAERMADVPATIATFTVDRLAYSPQPAGGGRGDRLRRRRPVPVRADRRRPGRGRDRRPGGDDLPPAVHRQTACTTTSGRHGPIRSRDTEETDHGIATASATGWPSSGWAARPSASTGTRAPTTCSSTPPSDALASAGIGLDDVDAFWLGTMGSGHVRAHPQPRRSRSTTSRSPASRTTAPPAPRRSATPATRWRRAPTTSPWPSASRS